MDNSLLRSIKFASVIPVYDLGEDVAEWRRALTAGDWSAV